MLLGGADEADYGMDLTAYVGASVTALELASLPGRIKSELLKDERIEDVEALVQTEREGLDTRLVVRLEVETSEGPFALQLAVTDVTAELVGIEVEG
jgi:hypothetical protein